VCVWEKNSRQFFGAYFKQFRTWFGNYPDFFYIFFGANDLFEFIKQLEHLADAT